MTEHRPKGRLTAAQRRAQLIDIGRETFADVGYEAATVEEIARRAGITKPIVYGHFGGKEGLYASIVEQEVSAVQMVILDAISSGPPRDRLAKAVLAFLEYVRDHPSGFVLLARDAPASSQYASMLSEIAARVGEIFADEFERAGYLASVGPIYAQALVGMVTYVGQWWHENRDHPMEDVADHLAALAWMGLRHLPRQPATIAAGGPGAAGPDRAGESEAP